MRVIAGKFRGITLYTLKDRTIRPTTDRVKENVFNLISSRLEGANVLDLFCGSGALGIEALSRGAKYAVFADRATDSVETARANISKIKADYKIVRNDFTVVVDSLAREGAKFDIIFLDPPYKQGLDTAAIKFIAEKGILQEGGVIVVERAREGEAPSLPSGYRIIDSRDYGSSTIELVEKATACAVTGTFDPFTVGHEYLVERALENFDIVYVVILVNPDKQATLSIEKRLKLISQSVRKFRRKVMVEFYDGLAIDYCKQNDIKYIVRGVRNSVDLEYEEAMAKWNYENGGIETLLITARDSEISSTLVRERLAKGEAISGLVNEEEEETLKNLKGRM